MIGEQTIRQAWLGLLNTDRDALYLTLFSSRMRRFHKAISVAVVLGATAALASFVAGVTGEWSGVIGNAIGLVVAGLAVWAVVSDFSKKAVVAATLADECRKIALEWRKLWATLSEMDDREALERISFLERKACETTKDVPHSLGLIRKLNEKSSVQTYELIKHEYPEAA